MLCRHVQKEGTLLEDGVPVKRDKEGVPEHANLRSEGRTLSGKETRLVYADPSQGATTGAEDGGNKDGAIRGTEVWRRKQVHRP